MSRRLRARYRCHYARDGSPGYKWLQSRRFKEDVRASHGKTVAISGEFHVFAALTFQPRPSLPRLHIKIKAKLLGATLNGRLRGKVAGSWLVGL